MSKLAGIPTLSMSLAIFESYLKSFRFTSTYVSFFISIQYIITIAEAMELNIVASEAPAEPNPST